MTSEMSYEQAIERAEGCGVSLLTARSIADGLPPDKNICRVHPAQVLPSPYFHTYDDGKITKVFSEDIKAQCGNTLNLASEFGKASYNSQDGAEIVNSLEIQGLNLA